MCRMQADIFFQASRDLSQIQRARYADALKHAMHELSVYFAQRFGQGVSTKSIRESVKAPLLISTLQETIPQIFNR